METIEGLPLSEVVACARWVLEGNFDCISVTLHGNAIAVHDPHKHLERGSGDFLILADDLICIRQPMRKAVMQVLGLHVPEEELREVLQNLARDQPQNLILVQKFFAKAGIPLPSIDP